MAAGRAGADARPRALSRLRDDPAARAARGAHRAGRDRRLDAGAGGRARRTAARCRSPCCSAPAIRHARDGYVGHAQPGAAHRRQARRAEGRAGLRADLPGRRQAARGRRDAQADRARRHARPARPCRARRFLSRRRRARDRRRSRTDRQPGDARRSRALPRHARRAAVGRARRRHALQHAAADAGPRLADDPRAVRAAAASPRPRASITSTAWSRRPSARSACATASITDPARLPHPPERYPRRRRSSTPRRAKIDRRKAAPWPAPPGEGDTIWMGAADASGLVVSYIQSLYWEFGSGCVLPRTGVLMQNRGASFSLDPGAAQRAGARPAAVPHAQSRRSPCSRDGRIMAYGTMGGDGQPQTQAALFTRHVALSPAARAGDRRAALAARPHLGLDAYQPAAGIALRRQSDRPPAVGRPRRRGAGGALFRHHGPCRRGGAASQRHAGRRARSARRRRRGGRVTFT